MPDTSLSTRGTEKLKEPERVFLRSTGRESVVEKLSFRDCLYQKHSNFAAPLCSQRLEGEKSELVWSLPGKLLHDCGGGWW